MAPFIQSLISNQAQWVDGIPIRDSDAVKPVHPIPEPIHNHTNTTKKPITSYTTENYNQYAFTHTK